MQQVHQTIGMIWVRTQDGRHYGETPENFERDYGQPMPAMPDGITSLEYEPGIRHTLKKGNDVVDGGPMPWPFGDEVLQSADRLHASKEARDLAAKEALEAKSKAETEAAAEAMRASMPKPRIAGAVADEFDKLRAEIASLKADIEQLKSART